MATTKKKTTAAPKATVPKTCFVVMGFGIKTDYSTGRKLDLDKSYRLLIKPAVEANGLTCIRADEIRHSGVIDVPMYEELFSADVVIADVSTANANAIYELGVRHALKPFSTIIISENKLVYPFDLNHIKITSYTHLGDAIDFEEVERFRKVLGDNLKEVLEKKEPDSPVYTYLQLMPPALKEQLEEAAAQMKEAVKQKLPKEGEALSIIVEQGKEALAASDFDKAKTLFASAVEIGKDKAETSVSPNDPYLIRSLALATSKAEKPNKLAALKAGLKLLEKIDLKHTNDPETVSMAGSMEKKLYEVGDGEEHLSSAILYFQRGYYLLNNRYNGINLAYTLNCRAASALCKTKEDQIADMMYAKYTRERVLYLCNKDWKELTDREKPDKTMIEDAKELSKQKDYYTEQKFWILINKAEAAFGLGDFKTYQTARKQAEAMEHADWMITAFDEQIERLRKLLKKKGSLMNPKWKEA